MKNNKKLLKTSSLAALLGTALMATGCATPGKTDNKDPWEATNRKVQIFNDKLDDYVMKPLAKGYQKVTPDFVDRGVTNFFSNVDDIATVFNDFFQFKFAQTAKDSGRLLLNSTAGLGGFIDVATRMNLPKHTEDFDQTLGVWGVSSGPYLVLPFVGPATPRGAFGLIGDAAANPLNWVGAAKISVPTATVKGVDARADLLSSTDIMDEASVDRYEFMRNAYLQQRNYMIHDGNPPIDEDSLEQQMDELDRSDKEAAAEAKTAKLKAEEAKQHELDTEKTNRKLDHLFKKQMMK